MSDERAILGRLILEEHAEDVLVGVLSSEEFKTNEDTVQGQKTKFSPLYLHSKRPEGTDKRRCPPTRK
jgi:hypothetical protein